jgi:hypothetical protein
MACLTDHAVSQIISEAMMTIARYLTARFSYLVATMRATA